MPSRSRSSGARGEPQVPLLQLAATCCNLLQLAAPVSRIRVPQAVRTAVRAHARTRARTCANISDSEGPPAPTPGPHPPPSHQGPFRVRVAAGSRGAPAVLLLCWAGLICPVVWSAFHQSNRRRSPVSGSAVEVRGGERERAGCCLCANTGGRDRDTMGWDRASRGAGFRIAQGLARPGPDRPAPKALRNASKSECARGRRDGRRRPQHPVRPAAATGPASRPA
jgi:hypothetical protein